MSSPLTSTKSLEGFHKTFSISPFIKDKPSHYCPGCGHGIVHRLVAELLDEMGLAEKTVFIAPVGCAVLAYDYLDLDCIEALHGRAPAVATGIKRAAPEKTVISYQGDGDLLSIGMAEMIHSANRGEHFTTIFINNAIYGMTGGQTAPTTLIGQKTVIAPQGRDPEKSGYPIDACHLLNSLDAPYYIARSHVADPKGIAKTKAMIKKALTYQTDGRGYSFVEVLSMCPTNWNMTPVDALDQVKNNMAKVYPLGVIRDKGEEEHV